jgi:hypothetical protein
MMEKLLSRGEQVALQAQQKQVRRIAEQLRMVVGVAAIDADEARVLVSGKGIIRRWLMDSGLRFLAGGLK